MLVRKLSEVSVASWTVVVSGIVVGWMLMGDGSPSRAEDDKSAKEAVPRVIQRLPTYFNRLGLTESQKTRIYAAQARYREEIDRLESQLAKTREAQWSEVEGILTAEQQGRLEQIRQDAKAKSAKTGDAEAKGSGAKDAGVKGAAGKTPGPKAPGK